MITFVTMTYTTVSAFALSSSSMKAFMNPSKTRFMDTRWMLKDSKCLNYYSCSNPERENLILDGRRSIITSIPTLLTLSSSSPAEALSLFQNNSERKQLELCLVTIMRLQRWADDVAARMYVGTEWDVTAYLEARLGAKAILTGRIGGGASKVVYELAPLKIKTCLEDAVFYAGTSVYKKKSEADGYRETILDALASIVEFDGLETTQDPSPRSSLMISMFNANKGMYVFRMIQERLLPACKQITRLYGEEKFLSCERFMLLNY